MVLSSGIYSKVAGLVLRQVAAVFTVTTDAHSPVEIDIHTLKIEIRAAKAPITKPEARVMKAEIGLILLPAKIGTVDEILHNHSAPVLHPETVLTAESVRSTQLKVDHDHSLMAVNRL